jgi:hypothetical protein
LARLTRVVRDGIRLNADGADRELAVTAQVLHANPAETQAWLDVALDCGYMDEHTHVALDRRYDQIIGSLVKMRHDADRWCGPASLTREPDTLYEYEPEA